MPASSRPTKRTVADIKANLLRPATTSHFEVDIPIPRSPNFRSNLGVQQEKLQIPGVPASIPNRVWNSSIRVLCHLWFLEVTIRWRIVPCKFMQRKSIPK